MTGSWKIHALALAAAAFALGVLFLQEPGFGDDLTYWSFAFDLHERGLKAWQRGSFHDLRWPVWGVSWITQAVVGPGLLSFYAVPLLYLVAGALLSFSFARLLTQRVGTAWLAGLAFVFHPLLDTVSYRPMPDLSEGVWGGAAVLCWWKLMHHTAPGRALAWAALTGLCLFIAQANRVTGAFVVPILIVCTLMLQPRRLPWLILAGVFAAFFYAAECFFYHQLFGDWLHSIHANLGNKGAKGTDEFVLWSAPFRFFDSLWKDSVLAPIYCVAALIGIVRVWRGPHENAAKVSPTRAFQLGRVVVLWFALLYLAYALAPQQLWPWRPMIRDADRFLCGLAMPMSVLVAIGLAWVASWLASRFGNRLPRLEARPVWMRAGLAAAVVALVALVSAREFFDLGFAPRMKRYMSALAPGTKVFTHKAMREIAFLADAQSAQRLTWFAPNEILHQTPKLEEMAAQCSEFWYARKLVWLTTRKKMERKQLVEQPPLGSYFDSAQNDWQVAAALAKGNTPDLIFSRRRDGSHPPSPVLDSLPFLPWPAGGTIKEKKGDRKLTKESGVDERLRGKLLRLRLRAAADDPEAITLRLRFVGGENGETEYLLKPYLYPSEGVDFFIVPVPPESLACIGELKIAPRAKSVRIGELTASIETPLVQP